MKLNKTGRFASLFASMVAVSAPAMADEAVKVGGYADINALSWNIDGSSIANSLQFAEGAAYITKSLGGGTFTFDLPVSPGAPGTILGVAGAEAQAFVAYKYDNGVSWKVGQFDGIFGLERNDTNAVTFTRQGVVYGLQPVVHTAVAVGYDITSDIGVTLYTGKDDGTSDQVGARVTYKMDGFNVGLGYRTDASAEFKPMYLDVTAGITAGDLNAGLGFVMDSTGVEGAVSQMGIAALGVYKLGESLSAGARFNMVTNAGYFDGASVMEITVGPQFAMTKDLTAKLDYTFGSINTGIEGVDAVTGSTVALNTVYNF